MEVQYFYKTKQEVAIHQLERAIDLFIQEEDIICATTLAGASEEIFGKLLEKNGGQSWLKEHTELCINLLQGSGNKISNLAFQADGYAAAQFIR